VREGETTTKGRRKKRERGQAHIDLYRSGAIFSASTKEPSS